MKQSINYVVWSGNEFMGRLSELNFKTALAKAKLLCRISGKSSYTLSTSTVYNQDVLAYGETTRKSIDRQGAFSQIAVILTHSPRRSTI